MLPDEQGTLVWRASRRLMHLRLHLHDPVKEYLGLDEYARVFDGAPFAALGGPRGTTGRLHVWLTALAKAINLGLLPPGIVAHMLRFTSAPEPDNFLPHVVPEIRFLPCMKEAQAHLERLSKDGVYAA